MVIRLLGARLGTNFKIKMTRTLDKVRNVLKTATQNQAIELGAVTFVIGTILTMTFIYIGIYNPDIVYFTLALLTILTIIFVLTIILLTIKTRLTWKIIVTAPLTIFLLALTWICVDSVFVIIKYGFLKCDLCP
jgi:hypothetical protein